MRKKFAGFHGKHGFFTGGNFALSYYTVWLFDNNFTSVLKVIFH
jgi:hypothetical protein